MTPAMTNMATTYAWPDSGRYIRLNMAVDVAGVFADEGGLSIGLSFPEDRHLLRLIRAGAEVVVVGANTVRSEGWNLPPTGTLVVLSASGNLPWESCPDSSRVRLIQGNLSAADVVQLLERDGVKRILIEGGASVARQFARLNVIDDVCLTVSSHNKTFQLEGSPPAAPDAFAAERALTRLLEVSPDQFALTSLIGASTAPAIFTLWRRAIGAQTEDAH